MQERKLNQIEVEAVRLGYDGDDGGNTRDELPTNLPTWCRAIEYFWGDETVSSHLCNPSILGRVGEVRDNHTKKVIKKSKKKKGSKL